MDIKYGTDITETVNEKRETTGVDNQYIVDEGSLRFCCTELKKAWVCNLIMVEDDSGKPMLIADRILPIRACPNCGEKINMIEIDKRKTKVIHWYEEKRIRERKTLVEVVKEWGKPR